MADEHWAEGFAKSLGIFLNGKTIPNPNPKGEPVVDDSFYIIFNAHHEAMGFALPDASWGEGWVKELDTDQGWIEGEETLEPGSRLQVGGRSMAVLRQLYT